MESHSFRAAAVPIRVTAEPVSTKSPGTASLDKITPASLAFTQLSAASPLTDSVSPICMAGSPATSVPAGKVRNGSCWSVKTCCAGALNVTPAPLGRTIGIWPRVWVLPSTASCISPPLTLVLSAIGLPRRASRTRAPSAVAVTSAPGAPLIACASRAATWARAWSAVAGPPVPSPLTVRSRAVTV